jgi:WD40 repeat protein
VVLPIRGSRWDLSRVMPAIVLTAAAAAVILAVVTFFAPQHHPNVGGEDTTVAVLEEAYGEVNLVTDDGEVTPITSGQRLHPGQIVRTGSIEGFAVVKYPDSTELELSTGTVLRLLEPEARESKRVFLQEGYVTGELPEEKPMVVLTPSAEIRVPGTRFRSSSTSGETRVEAEKGGVQLIRRTDGKAIDVPQGMFAVATTKAPESSFTPRPLPAQIKRKPTIFFDPAGPVPTIAYAPNGQTLATGGWNGDVNLWDPASGVLRRTLKGHTRRVLCVAYSPDGQTLYSTAADRTFRAWDAATGSERFVIKKLPRDASAMAVSADGKLVALTGAMHREKRDKRSATPPVVQPLVLLVNTETGVEQRSFPAPGDEVVSLAFAPNGMLALGCKDGTVTLWDVYAGLAVQTLNGLGGRVLSVAFSRDGRWLAAGNQNSTLRVWDMTHQMPERTFFGRTLEARAIAFSQDGRYLAAGGNAGLVTIWDVESGKEQLDFRAHKNVVGAVAFAPDCRSIASSGWDRNIRVWPLVAD